MAFKGGHLGTSPETIRQFQEELKNYADLKEYFPLQMTDSYNLMPRRAKKATDELFKHVKREEITALEKNKVFGVVEEASDTFFELMTLKVLNLNNKLGAVPVVSDQMVDKAVTLLREKHQDRQDFPSLIDSIKKGISPSQLEAFHQLTQWQDEKNKSDNFLALIICKFALMRKRSIDKGAVYNLDKENRELLKGEAKELIEKLPGYKHFFKRLKVQTLALAYTYFPNLPTQFFMKQMLGIVQNRIHAPNTTINDLMSCVYIKQLSRQEFDYNHPQFDKNKDRKAHLKSYEMISEGLSLKNILLGHPLGIGLKKLAPAMGLE